jgi:enolase
VGDEGGFAPPTRELDSLELLKEAIHTAGHEGIKIFKRQN